ncbi:MAG: phospho-N-acetylmuramoyl-pentapeptide-transferase [Akkermansiaceae bacterium]|nr:phospho-N-acetylmuramoyl-pentapeptide-transferase [Akkermansiaceae bacterium]
MLQLIKTDSLFAVMLINWFIPIVLPFVLSMFIGPRLIAILRAMKAGQPIREASKGVLAPEHSSKVGTPTMGGIMIIGLILLTILLCADLTDARIHCILLVSCVTAFLGFLDDYAKITKKSSDGVSGKFKIALQFVAALGCAFYLYYSLPKLTYLYIPFYGYCDIGFLFIPLALLVIIGASNAVNLTDGLDGLASGCMIIVALAYLLILPPVFSPVMLAVAAACAGFLWFNSHPARVFMGDTGSLALGGLLGTVAVCSCTPFLLVIIGGVFVAEACSVMIQVFWFKYTRKKYGEGRRFFLMAPIHHHYEKKGWSETQVCVRFWLITLLLSLLGYGIFLADALKPIL